MHASFEVQPFSNVGNCPFVHCPPPSFEWKTQLEGVGPIGHSEYLNAVQLRMIDGRPTVFGWESAAKYIESLDPTTGAAVYHVKL